MEKSFENEKKQKKDRRAEKSCLRELMSAVTASSSRD